MSQKYPGIENSILRSGGGVGIDEAGIRFG